jgi:hypothetical protein
VKMFPGSVSQVLIFWKLLDGGGSIELNPPSLLITIVARETKECAIVHTPIYSILSNV